MYYFSHSKAGPTSNSTINTPSPPRAEEWRIYFALSPKILFSLCLRPVVLQLNPKGSPPSSQSPEMVLDLQLAFSILLAGLVLLCVLVAKLREMAEAGRAAHQGPILRPLKDEADVVLLGSRDQHECKRRVRFEDDARRCDGLKGFSGKSGKHNIKKWPSQRFWVISVFSW